MKKNRTVPLYRRRRDELEGSLRIALAVLSIIKVALSILFAVIHGL